MSGRGSDRGRGRGGRGARGGGAGGGGGPPGRGGGGPPRGGAGPGRGRGGGQTMTPLSTNLQLPAAVNAIGVRRTGYGTQGRRIHVQANAFETPIPDGMIYHYDAMSPSETSLPRKKTFQIMVLLQEQHAGIFSPLCPYDGRKNLYSTRELQLPEQSFAVPFEGKTFKVKLALAAKINPESLHRFIEGKQAYDGTVQTAINALNVAARMEPSKTYPFNTRCFYSPEGSQRVQRFPVDIWRGYFMSIRPAVGKMIVNVDISCGLMYRPGPLIDLCLQFTGARDVAELANLARNDRQLRKLQRFVSGMRVNAQQVTGQTIGRSIKRLLPQAANAYRFTDHEGQSLTVAQYFQGHNAPLRFPNLFGIEVGRGAYFPLERCTVPQGEIMRKEIPSDVTAEMVSFSKVTPQGRFDAINQGLNNVLGFGQSEYVRNFGMAASGPLTIPARVLPPPKLKYGSGSKQPVIDPRFGAWNMIDKTFFKPCAPIKSWVVVSYERPNRFSAQQAVDMGKDIVRNCRKVGINITDRFDHFESLNGQGNVSQQLTGIGSRVKSQKGLPPDLFIIVIPEGANDIYNKIKHFGDIRLGVATQCIKSKHASASKDQYWANVCLKINVKLGGINSIPNDKQQFMDTIIMGADAQHPPPGADGKPSFTAMVSSVDADVSKYIATSRVQPHREMISDFEDMAYTLLTQVAGYRTNVEKNARPPKRILFFRDGVSEGEFSQVIEQEIPKLKAACKKLGIKPQITFIVVVKRHHMRFNPRPDDADRSGNAPAGTVVDTDITHPIEYDYFLQSHAGLLGTSRSSHYTVLLNECNINPDGLQAMSYTLCHVYAKATRSVSIPAPVYYADIVCDRAKHHYDPYGDDNLSEATGSDSVNVDKLVQAFQPIHAIQSRRMYFS